MQLQLPMVVGKKGTKEEEEKEVKTVKLRWDQFSYQDVFLIFPVIFPKSKMLSRWDQQGEAELRMEEGRLVSKEERQVTKNLKA